MSEKRDIFRYELLNGDEMVAVGTSHSPHRVARDYSADGLEVSDVRIIGPAISREAAGFEWNNASINIAARMMERTPGAIRRKYNSSC